MFWDVGAFHVSWAVQHQSENPSCPILRTLESLSKTVPNARCNRRASSSPQPPRGKTEFRASNGWRLFWVLDGTAFWFLETKNLVRFPPPLFGPYVYPPPSQFCQQYQGTQFSTIRFPPPPTEMPATPYVFTPQENAFWITAETLPNSDATGLVWQETSLRDFSGGGLCWNPLVSVCDEKLILGVPKSQCCRALCLAVVACTFLSRRPTCKDPAQRA